MNDFRLFVELSPGVNVELDKSGSVICLEVFNAAVRFLKKTAPKPSQNRLFGTQKGLIGRKSRA
jgi:uncharacterized protein YuzE